MTKMAICFALIESLSSKITEKNGETAVMSLLYNTESECNVIQLQQKTMSIKIGSGFKYKLILRSYIFRNFDFVVINGRWTISGTSFCIEVIYRSC